VHFSTSRRILSREKPEKRPAVGKEHGQKEQGDADAAVEDRLLEIERAGSERQGGDERNRKGAGHGRDRIEQSDLQGAEGGQHDQGS
jgi:hypothetical protein